MACRRDINDIDEDDEGQIIDYSGDSDNGDKPTEILLRRSSDVVLLQTKGHLIHPNLLSFPS